VAGLAVDLGHTVRGARGGGVVEPGTVRRVEDLREVQDVAHAHVGDRHGGQFKGAPAGVDGPHQIPSCAPLRHFADPRWKVPEGDNRSARADGEWRANC